MNNYYENFNRIKELIKGNDKPELEKFIKDNKILSEYFDDFDSIIIYCIENSASIEIFQYIVDQRTNKDFNGYRTENNINKSLLKYAIGYNEFKMADILINRGANINFYTVGEDTITYLSKLNLLNKENLKYILSHGFSKTSLNSKVIYEVIKTKRNELMETIFEYFKRDNSFLISVLDEKCLKCLLNNGFHYKSITTEFIDRLIQTSNNKFLKIIFDNYVFDKIFIVQFLQFYKSKTALSNKNLQELISKEKNKIIIHDYMYIWANLSPDNDETLSILMENDGSGDLIVYNRIIKYNIFEKLVKANHFYCLKNLLNYYSFNYKYYNYESIFADVFNTYKDNKNDQKNNKNNKNNNNILKLLIKSFINSSVKENNKLKGNSENYNSQCLNLILNLAIKNNHLKIIKYLIEEEEEFKTIVDLNLKDINGVYPLFEALASNNNNIFYYLLAHGANGNIKNNNGLSLLSSCLQKNKYEMVKYLLQYKIQLNEIDIAKSNPLFTAIRRKSFDMVVLLMNYAIKNNIDLDVNDISNNSPLIFSYYSNFEIFKYLANYFNINKNDSNSNLMLFHAVEENNMDKVKYLIRLGVDINHKNKLGSNVLDFAISKGKKDMIKCLINQSQIALNEVNTKGETALISIIISNKLNESEKVDFIKCLIEKGSDVNMVDKDGKSALIYAIIKKYSTIIKLIINNNGNVNLINEIDNKKTILMYAIDNGDSDLVECILENNANVNSMDKNGDTALTYAIQNRDSNKVKCLIKWGADIHLKNNQNKTFSDINYRYNYDNYYKDYNLIRQYLDY